MKKLLILLGFFLSLVCQADKPRVASINLCADRLVLALADKDQIVSLSHLATDPNSMIKPLDFKVPLNHGQLEEMLQFEVDFIVASEFDNRLILSRLNQYGKRIERFSEVKSLNEAIENVRRMALLLDQNERSAQVISQIHNIKEAKKTDNKPRTLILGANGYISGIHSLASDLVQILGYDNVADEINMKEYGQISLEQVIVLAPEILILNQYSSDYSRAQSLFLHPVLKQLNKTAIIYKVPSREWICGDNALARVVGRLH